ncbi:MAG: DUF3307 domain-containing protein [Lachnospiraceae bacterium]|nr:DUF3307 domain-containing protein [Lachnospiraceae bacterium]
MIFWMMVAGHFLADFTLQSSNLAKRKQESMVFLLMHVAIYTVAIGLVAGVCVEYTKLPEPLFLIAATHFLTDGVKISIDKNAMQKKWEFWSFIIDQMLHLLVIAYVVWYYKWELYRSGLWSRLLGWEQLGSAILYGVTFLIL